MKSPFAPSLRFLLGLGLAFSGALRTAHAEEEVLLSPQQLDQLMGPIALYPDALVALILPASTVPTDIVLAQRFLSTGGDPDQIDNQPWTESVRGLARYPSLIQWLDENLPWTRQLGSVFLNQPDELMDSVQRLRARAKANGTLTSTPQQKLVLDGDDIQIVPARPDVIYVPYYDPALVYNQPVYYGAPPFVTFGMGSSVGYWLSYDCNWQTRVIVVGDRHHNWAGYRDWRHPPGPGGKPYYGNNWRPWTPPANRTPYPRQDSHRPYPGGVIQPRPYPRNPSNPPHERPSDSPHEHQPNQPYPDDNPRTRDHNRGPAPTHTPSETQPNFDPRNSSGFGPRPDNRSQPGNGPHPNYPTNPSSPTPRPEPSNPRQPPPGSMPNPPPPTPTTQPLRPAPPHAPDVRPGNVPPPPRPVPPPPPAPKDRPIDEINEVQR